MAGTQFSRTSPNNGRKPNSQTRAFWDAILDIANDYSQMSVRQLYYQMVSRGYVEKTERAYKRVADASVQMRLSGVLPYTKIVDGNRERRRAKLFGSMEEALQNTADIYRRNYWINQTQHVEVWSEKDALSGIMWPVCHAYGVPYIASRGFPSLTIRYESSQEFLRIGKPVTVFYFGDHDASGRSISNNLQDELCQHGADVTVERIALEPEQILKYSLPTRPGKSTDSRQRKFAAEFGNASVELDALPPNVLSDLVRNCIASVIDWDEWHRIEEIERLERTTVQSLATAGFTPGSVYRVGEDAA